MTIIETLLADGWREWPDQFRKETRAFYKQFETPTRCACNDDKSGIQVVIHVNNDEFGPQYQYDFDLSGRLPDGTWIKLGQWITPPDINDGLNLIPRLLATWEFVATFSALTTSSRDPRLGGAEPRAKSPSICEGPR
jgi:hypothetical protein